MVRSAYDYGSASAIPKVPSVKRHGGSSKSEQEPVSVPEPEPYGEDVPDVHEATSVSNNDTMQDGVLRDSSGKKTVPGGRKAPTVRKKVSKSSIQIRDFPRDVMDIVRGIVPGGNSYVETLLAYIYVTSPVKFDIPPNVQAIVEGYEQDDPQARILSEIRLLREQVKNVEMSSYRGTLASEYMLFDRLGFRKKDANHPSEVDYLEPGIEDMHIALENGAAQMKKKDNIRHGRGRK